MPLNRDADGSYCTDYKTKSVELGDGLNGCSVMLTVMNPRENPALDGAGFRNRKYLFVVVLGPSVVDCSYDMYSIDLPADWMYSFVRMVERGVLTDGDDGIPWEDVADGDRWEPEDVSKYGRED